MGDHPRNTGPMLTSPRCGAKTRSGKPCCRMHGGAKGSGASAGNQNALKHGLYTKEAIAERKALRSFMRKAKEHLDRIEEL